MTFRDWMADKSLDLSEWTELPAPSLHHEHLWLRDPNDYADMWASVTDDFETWEYRRCVLCGTQQIREFPS